MAHTGSTLVHRPSGVQHHRTALVLVGAAILLLAASLAISVVRTTPVPTSSVDPAPVATAAPWLRATLQSEYLVRIADRGTWGVGAAHPVATVPSMVDRIRAWIHSEYLLSMAMEDRWNDPLPAVALTDRLESGHLRAIALAGHWGVPAAGGSWPTVSFLDRFESGYLRELAGHWGR